jgi:membrane protein
MKIPFRKLALRVWKRVLDDDMFDQAAQLSYYFLFAIFPLLLLLTTLFGLMATTGSEIYENLLSYAREVLPYNAFELMVTTLREVQKGAGGGKLSVGILATLWAASSGMAGLITGLNRAYEVKETRAWWKARLIATGLTLLIPIFVATALILVLYGTRLADLVTGYFGLETYFARLWDIAQWPVAIVFLFVAVALLYRYAPACSRKTWRQDLPGAVTGVVLWLVLSLLFRLYLQYFNSYNRTYGSLGAVMVLLLWFYLSGAAILIGAEVNSEWAKS